MGVRYKMHIILQSLSLPPCVTKPSILLTGHVAAQSSQLPRKSSVATDTLCPMRSKCVSFVGCACPSPLWPLGHRFRGSCLGLWGPQPHQGWWSNRGLYPSQRGAELPHRFGAFNWERENSICFSHSYSGILSLHQTYTLTKRGCLKADASENPW